MCLPIVFQQCDFDFAGNWHAEAVEEYEEEEALKPIRHNCIDVGTSIIKRVCKVYISERMRDCPGCQSTRHTVNSSPGQLVTQSTRHAVDSSQRGGQLVTSKQTSKHQSRTAAAVITLTAAITQKMHKKLSRKQSEQQSTCSVMLTARAVSRTTCDHVNLRPLLKPTSL